MELAKLGGRHHSPYVSEAGHGDKAGRLAWKIEGFDTSGQLLSEFMHGPKKNPERVRALIDIINRDNYMPIEDTQSC